MAQKQIKSEKSLKEQREDLILRAKEAGVDNDYLFLTALDRYDHQLKNLDGLNDCIEKNGVTYVKNMSNGSTNVAVNPAISEYNKTTSAANGTVSILLKIIEKNTADSDQKKTDEMASFLNSD